jgi:hypothetical protein
LYELIGAGKVRAVKDGTRTKVEIASGDVYFATLPDFRTVDTAKCDPRRKGKTAQAAADSNPTIP